MKLFKKEPTEKETEEVEREAGWSTCQDTVKSAIEMNEITEIELDD